MNFTFAQMNPDFSGAYLAIAGGDITTTKMFDNKSELYSWIIDKIEVQGFEYVETTVIGEMVRLMIGYWPNVHYGDLLRIAISMDRLNLNVVNQSMLLITLH